MNNALNFSPADAAVIETFVVPRYLGLYAQLALDMLLAEGAISLAHLGCRTGFPDRELAARLPGSLITGVDVSESAIELARVKAATVTDSQLEYRVAPLQDNGLGSGEFSHALALHPLVHGNERAMLFGELSRLLYAGGQALVALPMRGSFVEIHDLFREYALKQDEGEFSKRIESSVELQPNLEMLEEELEGAGLFDVDVEVRQVQLQFDSGRAFAEDPVSRLILVPEFSLAFDTNDLAEPFRYVCEAIDKYWSEAKFELTLNIGCASARKPG